MSDERTERAAREIEKLIFDAGLSIEGGVLRDILKEELEGGDASSTQKMKYNFPAAPVLEEPIRDTPTLRNGEVRQASMNVAAAGNPSYENMPNPQRTDAGVPQTRQTESETVPSSGLSEMRERAQSLSDKQSRESKVSGSLETEDCRPSGKDPETRELREVRGKEEAGWASSRLQETSGSDVAVSKMSRSDLTQSGGETLCEGGDAPCHTHHSDANAIPIASSSIQVVQSTASSEGAGKVPAPAAPECPICAFYARARIAMIVNVNGSTAKCPRCHYEMNIKPK